MKMVLTCPNKSVLMVGPAVPPVVLINGQAEPPVLPSRTTQFSEEDYEPPVHSTA
jgi:hypothetical protein